MALTAYETQHRLITASASEHWPNRDDFANDTDGDQICLIDGAVEGPAFTDRRAGLAAHITHGQAAHVADMLNGTRSATAAQTT